MTQPKEGLVKLLGRVFDDLQQVDDPVEHARKKQEFIFHMADWVDDLKELASLYENPDPHESEASKLIAGFLYHVIPHLNAAGRLALDRIPDAFKKSNVSEREMPK